MSSRSRMSPNMAMKYQSLVCSERGISARLITSSLRRLTSVACFGWDIFVTDWLRDGVKRIWIGNY